MGGPDLRSASDAELVALMRQECHDALAVLFDRYQRKGFAVALRILRDAGEAEDVTQEVFFEIYRKASHYDPQRGSVAVWLLQFVYHRSISRKRALMVRHFYDPSDHEAVANIPSREGELWNGLSMREWTGLIQQSLAALNEKQRITLELAYRDQLSLKEIAQRTNRSFGNVRHYYYRGVRRLRELMMGRSENERTIAMSEVPDEQN